MFLCFINSLIFHNTFRLQQDHLQVDIIYSRLVSSVQGSVVIKTRYL